MLKQYVVIIVFSAILFTVALIALSLI